MTYNIIRDELELTKFIKWLPELSEGEMLYVSLFARRKYHESAKNDKSQCKRFTATDKRYLLRKIKQLEIADGMYTNKDGSSAHSDSLALYISVNPRSVKKAQTLLIKKLLDVVLTDNNFQNPTSLALSSIQKARSRTCYVDFDFDIKDLSKQNIDKNVNQVLEYVNSEAVTFIRTRGGFHALVDPNKIDTAYKKSWYKSIQNMDAVDACGDNLIPVCGCVQGGFTPYIYSTEK